MDRRLLALAVSMVLTAALIAQTPQGSIAGTVLDPVGKVAPAVAVQATGADGKVVRATADAAGKYQLANLAPGTYDIAVNVAGLRGFEQKGVVVTAGATTTANIRLQEGTQLSTLGEDPAGIAADRLRHKPPSGPTTTQMPSFSTSTFEASTSSLLTVCSAA